MKKKVATALLASTFALASLAPAAFAVSDNFGAGASGGGPQAPNAHCHPPGQTSDLPQCR